MDTIIKINQNGSGDYTSIGAAVSALPEGDERLILQIAPGTYREKILLTRPNVTFLGEKAEDTVIVWGDGSKTLRPDGEMMRTQETYTVRVEGDGFQAENITFQNDFGLGENEGPHCGQAIAGAFDADRVSIRNCRFLGSQDTLYVGAAGFGHRQYYRDCYILGDVDFIFGGGNIVFEHCVIESLDRGNVFTVEDVEGTFNGYLTADGSKPDEIGMVFRECELISTAAPGSVYLGRPWKDYGATTYINCKMGAHIHPAGWAKWRREKHHETCRYAEYGSTGPGASPETRCSFSRQLTFAEALQYSVNKVLGGKDGWDPRY